MKIKIVDGEDVRLLNTSETQPLKILEEVQKCVLSFKNGPFKLKYEDEEKEMILLESAEDVREAFKAAALANKVCRVYVQAKAEAAPENKEQHKAGRGCPRQWAGRGLKHVLLKMQSCEGYKEAVLSWLNNVKEAVTGGKDLKAAAKEALGNFPILANDKRFVRVMNSFSVFEGVIQQMMQKCSVANLAERLRSMTLREKDACVCGEKLVRKNGRECYGLANTWLQCDGCDKHIPINKDCWHCEKGHTDKHPQGFDLCLACMDNSLCICGEKLEKMDKLQCYPSGCAYCDRCSRLIPDGEYVSHCPKDKCAEHPSGFDLCVRCAPIQEEEQKKPKEPEPEQEAEAVVVVKEVPVSVPEQEQAEAKEEEVPRVWSVPFCNGGRYVYEEQLTKLRQMGFTNEAKMREALESSIGDVQSAAIKMLDRFK